MYESASEPLILFFDLCFVLFCFCATIITTQRYYISGVGDDFLLDSWYCYKPWKIPPWNRVGIRREKTLTKCSSKVVKLKMTLNFINKVGTVIFNYEQIKGTAFIKTNIFSFFYLIIEANFYLYYYQRHYSKTFTQDS